MNTTQKTERRVLLEQLVEKSYGKPSGLLWGSSLDRGRVKTAIQAFARDVRPEEVIAVLCEKVHWYRWDGFLLTEKALYSSWAQRDARKCPFVPLEGLKVSNQAGSNSVFYYRDGTVIRPFLNQECKYIVRLFGEYLRQYAPDGMSPEEYRAMAAGGNLGAMKKLSRYYRVGSGAQKPDPFQALCWGAGAALQLDKEAREALPQLEKDYRLWLGSVNRVKKSPPQGLGAATAKAMEGTPLQEEYHRYFVNQAKNGDKMAADILHFNAKAAENDAEASFWLWWTAKDGDMASMHDLAISYKQGRGVARNEREAFNWWQKAAEAGDGNSMLQVAYCYEKGEGAPRKDAAQAILWCQRALEAGKKDALARLGDLYFEGEGSVPQDKAKAVEFYTQGAYAGDEYAMYSLAFCYWRGQGTRADMVKAVKWAQKAADAGSTSAKELLEKMR